jgi:hypothetical protein
MKIETGQVFLYQEDVTTAPIEGNDQAFIAVGPSRGRLGLDVNLLTFREDEEGAYLERRLLRRMPEWSTTLQGMRAGVLALRHEDQL